jgi:hypothetical protein
MPDSSTLSNLDNIRVKVRRLTRAPSVLQLTDDQIDAYINTFVLYDFPANVKHFDLKTNLTFYCSPWIDTYDTVAAPVTHPLYNFNNRYTVIDNPVYIAGYKGLFSQSQEQFYTLYPKTNNIANTGQRGNSVLTNFTGTLVGRPILRNNVTFTSVSSTNTGLVLIDDGNGNLVVPNGVATVPASTINYITGAYVLNFPQPVLTGTAIYSQTIVYATARPQSVLFYDNKFILRPVPDQPYRIDLAVEMRPAEFISTSPFQQPEIAQWYQYIAYGAAKKIFEDRNDMDSVQQIMPEFKEQQKLSMRKTIGQLSSQRSSTIYAENSGIGWGGTGFGPW